MIKFLFFIEREFHISLFENIINYISENNIGEVSILTVPYRPSQNGNLSIGCRKDFLRQKILHKFFFVENPYIFKPDITFLADSSYEKVEGFGKIVNIGHGTISKGSFYTPGDLSFRENCADLLAVPGKIHKQILEKKVNIPIEVVGIPKLDHLYDNSINKESILKMMKLDRRNKTILFAPTFNKELSLLTYIDVELRKIIPQNYNIIIKLHGVEEKRVKEYYKEYAKLNENIYYDCDYNIAKSCYVSDALITDVSSVIYEFLSTVKPILLFDSPLQKHFKKYNPDDLEYEYRNVGFRFSEIESIPKLLSKIFSSELEDFTKISEKFVTIHDGKSSKIVVNKSLELLRDNQKGMIILKDRNNLDYFTNKYENKFNIAIYNSKQSFNEYLLENKRIFLKFKQIVFMDSSLRYSPLYPCLMIQHLKNNGKAKITCSFNRKIKSQQNIDRFIPEVKKVNNERIGGPLTYLYSGKEANLEYFDQDSFAFDVEKMFAIITKNDFGILSNWKIFLENYDLNEKILAQDCFIW